MNSQQKPSFEGYQSWLKNTLDVRIKPSDSQKYDADTRRIRDQALESLFWSELNAQLPTMNDRYLFETGHPLWTPSKVMLHVKPYASTIEKSYRRNVLDNRNWPGAPSNEWVTPQNWYEKINDIVRCLIIVKYLDGVEFIVEEVRKLSEQLGLSCQRHFEARPEGYYAAHVYIPIDCEIPTGVRTKTIRVNLELQFVTQLQELVRNLLHTYYETRRMQSARRRDNWQWKYQSEEFSANYLAHILHYVEGMLVNVRNQQKGTLS